MREIIVQGVTTPIREVGSGKPVIFLHGVPDSGALWDGVAEGLKDHYRCIAPDIPGLGASVAPKDFDYSIANRGKWVQDLLDALDIHEPVHMVGHDHGGIFAAAWAVSYEANLSKLCLTDTLFQRDYHWHFWARLWRTPLVGEFFMYGQLFAFNYWLFEYEMRRGSKGLAREHVREVQKRLTYPALRHTLRLYRASDPELLTGWDDKLWALVKRVPTLVLWGEKDQYIDMAFPRRLAEHGAKLVSFPDAGHWLPVEKAEEFAANLREFLDS